MTHQIFMQRCFDLARLGAGNVSPNPTVGAVLVHEGRIIGEGWHQQYGQAHAEVNAVNSVQAEEKRYIPDSTLYVSLEPCNIQGKTPPCTSLILKEKIKKVVIACIDQTPEVKGGGVSILENAGVEVVHGVLEKKGQAISAFRNTFTAKRRPFIQLKFAKSKNGYMGQSGHQVWISNLYSKRLAHKYRAEYDAILIGTTTALIDNPQLNNRLWYGKSPLRIVLDRHLKIPLPNHVFSEGSTTWVITEKEKPLQAKDHVEYYSFPFDENLIEQILALLFENKKSSLIVEGGAYTLNQFIRKQLWDEAWVFTGNKVIKEGIEAPLVFGEILGEWHLADDQLTIFQNSGS